MSAVGRPNVDEQRAAPIAPPQAASAPVASAVSSVLTGLTDALSGGAPAVPTDTAVAAMLAVSRRELRVTAIAQAAASKSAAAAQTAATTTTGIEGEKMTLSGAASKVSDKNASSGYVLALKGSGTASTTMTLPAQTALTLRVKTSAGAPNMTLSVDGVPYTTLLVNSTAYTDYTFAGGISAGTHVISISSTSASARNILYVDKVTTSSGAIVDEFVGKSGSAPGSMWSAVSGSGLDSGIQTYAAGNALLDGQGHLVIQATKGKAGSYTSGEVWTKNTMVMGYGTITARVKIPAGQGLWPAVWLMGADSDVLGWPAAGEIDVMEMPSTTTTIYSTLHGPIAGTTNNEQAQIVTSKLPDLSAGYHDYWVRHLPDEITFGLDGQTLGTLTPASLSPGETWVYNRPMYMILNLAVGGPWAGAPNSSTQFPAKMIVESVRFDPS